MNETEEKNQMTQEEYKARVLSQNFANRCAGYEDAIASLQTQIAMMEQQMRQLEESVTEPKAEVVSEVQSLV
jgi:exonuclease VII small subunit